MSRPGSRVGGIGPAPEPCRTCPRVAGNPDAVEGSCCNEAPHHAAARLRTPEEDDGVRQATLRRRAVDRMVGQPGEILCPVCSWWMDTWIGQTDGDPHPDMPHGECVNCEWSF